MVADTGFTNGTPRDPTDIGGSGDTSPIVRPSDARFLCRQILRGWITDPMDLKTGIDVLRVVATDKNQRAGTRALAAKALTEAMQNTVALTLRLAEADDKASRLDSGLPTENVRVFAVRIQEAEALEHRAHPS